MRAESLLPRSSTLRACFVTLLFSLWHHVAHAQFTFTTNSGALTITGYAGPGGAVRIPASIDGYVVTEIDDLAFYRYDGFNHVAITNIALPDTITNIGYEAFAYCFSLAGATLGTNIASIGNAAFNSCGLTTLTIPPSVTRIGSSAFAGCSGLTTLKLSSGISVIGDSAFSGCWMLTNVTLPNSLISIGDAAFSGLSRVATFNIPYGVTNIGRRAFSRCSSLTAITVDDLNAFYTSVDGVLLDKHLGALIQYPIGNTNQNYAVPSTVTSIWEYAFAVCFSLTSVNLPSGVRSIEDGAFLSCANLSSISIPENVACIGSRVFDSCYRIATIVVPDSVTTVSYTHLTLPTNREV